METTLSETELETGLRGVLDRVWGGERFVVEYDGERVATIAPVAARPGITLRELIAQLDDLEMPGDGFADDLEAIQAAQGIAELPDWPDRSTPASLSGWSGAACG